MSPGPIPQNPLLVVLPNTPVVITPSHMHLAEPPALLKTPPAKAVVAKATGDQDARVLEFPNSKSQSWLGSQKTPLQVMR